MPVKLFLFVFSVLFSTSVFSQKEMHGLIDSLFNCESPNISACGAPTYIDFKEGYLDGLFSK